MVKFKPNLKYRLMDQVRRSFTTVSICILIRKFSAKGKKILIFNNNK